MRDEHGSTRPPLTHHTHGTQVLMCHFVVFVSELSEEKQNTLIIKGKGFWTGHVIKGKELQSPIEIRLRAQCKVNRKEKINYDKQY